MFEQFDFLDMYVLRAGQRPCLRVTSRIPRASGAQQALFTPEPRAKSQEPTIATVLLSCNAYMTAGHLKFVPNFLRIFPIFLLSSHFQRLSECPLLHGNPL